MELICELSERLTVLLQKRAWREVIKVATRILRLEPGHLIARESLAQAYWHTSEYPSCIQATKKLTALNPHESGYFLLQGMCQLMMGRYEAALRCMHRALSVANRDSVKSQIQQHIDHVEEIVSLAVHTLRSNDPLFDAAFKKDPAGACAAIGLNFTGDDLPTLPMPVWPGGVFARPN